MRKHWILSLALAASLTGCPKPAENPVALAPAPTEVAPARTPTSAEEASRPTEPEPTEPEPAEPEPAEPAQEAAPPGRTASPETPRQDLSLDLLGDVAGGVDLVDVDAGSLGGEDLNRPALTEEEELARLRERAKILDAAPPPPRRTKRSTKRSAKRSAKRQQPASRAAHPRWNTNFVRVRAESKRTGRPILAFFTGSDWCGWCHKLEGEVFNTSEFATWASNKVILLKLDFPKKRVLAAALKRQNQGLARRYRVKGYPTVVFLNGEGTALGKSGYGKGGPKPWIAKAESLLK